MAISTKAELKTAVAEYLDRDNLNLDTLIRLADDVFNLRMPELRTMEGAKFALDADSDTNWLLTNYPNAYLAAVLVEAFAFARNLDAASEWQGRLNAIIDAVLWNDDRGASREPLSIDPSLWPYDIGFNIVTGE